VFEGLELCGGRADKGMHAEEDEVIQLICHGNTADHRSISCKLLGTLEKHLIFVAAFGDEGSEAEEGAGVVLLTDADRTVINHYHALGGGCLREGKRKRGFYLWSWGKTISTRARRSVATTRCKKPSRNL
jgi:hypothetical protein